MACMHYANYVIFDELTVSETFLPSFNLSRAEAKSVAKRFVRSVIRVFVVFNVEMSPAQVISNYT